MENTTTSFANDISPMFAQYRDRMMWRLDLTDYEDVKENSSIIYTQISEGQMPPSNAGKRFTKEQVELFKQWMADEFPA